MGPKWKMMVNAHAMRSEAHTMKRGDKNKC